MGKVVLHLEKASGSDSGMSAHIERTITPKNVIPIRTCFNKEFIDFPPGIKSRTQAIQHRLETAGVKRKIANNQVRAIRVIQSGSPEDMKRIEQMGQLDEWCKDSVEWLQRTYGKDNIVSAVLHMDESTPHIHATVTPIVTSPRRKKKKENDPTKKKYRTKTTDTVRLCADDIMNRVKLKEYQTSYAEAMAKYGLERGIDGSKAKHISTEQYYRDAVKQTENLQKDVANLDTQKKEKQVELIQLKNDVSKEKLKNSVAEIGSKFIDGVNSILPTPKLVKTENENSQLKEEIQSLTEANNKYREEIDTVRRESQVQIRNNTAKSQQQENKLKDEISELKKLVNKIFSLFPYVKDLLNIEEVCMKIGLGVESINKLFNKMIVEFKGKLKSQEYNRSFETPNSLIRIESDSNQPNRYRLSIDGFDVKEWFRTKYQEFLLSKNKGSDLGGNRGFKR